ncbi:MAG: transposase [Saprospiraceae bacterium]|nr:transposase [Saprospiraceae bacterium]
MQRRKLIKPDFFRDFFLHTTQAFYHRFPVKTWRRFRLLAVDGTGLRLPDESWLGEALGWHENQHGHVPSVRWLITFDLLNQIIIKVQLHPRRQGEIAVAMPLIKDMPANTLAIYDRGFAGFAIPFLHRFYGTHCIIRLKTDFNPTVVDFVQSNETERIITPRLTHRALSAVCKLGLEPSRNEVIPLRLIRVDLPSGEVEVLLTTLMHRQHFHHRHFADLYNRALFAMYNLQSILIASKQKALQRINQRRKFDYQINRNVTVGIIKRYLPLLFIDEIKAWYAKIHCLLDDLIRHLEPIRPRPSRVRKRKFLRGTERHIYEPNYKSTL